MMKNNHDTNVLNIREEIKIQFTLFVNGFLFHDGAITFMLPWKPKQRGKMNYTCLANQR